MTIQRVINYQVFMAGETNGPPVVIRAQQSSLSLKPGEKVDITGVVSQMPVQMQGWELAADAGKDLKRYPIFVNATHLHAHQAAPGKPVPRPGAQR